MKLEVLNIKGEKTGKSVDLSDDIFGVEPNEHVVYLAVKQYLANQRQGTHKSKERGEITGSTKKLKRQKGTGTARAGSIKSPVFRGGGRIFGPRPRNYSQKLNKKVRRLARKSALSSRMQDGNIYVIEDFSFDSPKTKAYLDILNNLGLSDKKTTLVLGDYDNNVYLASRNIPNADVQAASDLNTYQVLNSNALILSEGSLKAIEQTFA